MKTTNTPEPRVLDRFTFDKWINELTSGNLCNSPTGNPWRRTIHPRLVKDNMAPVMWCGIELVGNQVCLAVGDQPSGSKNFTVPHQSVTVEWLVERTKTKLWELSPKHASLLAPVRVLDNEGK